MNLDEIQKIMNDPVAENLIQAPVHARLAYTAKDGFPRVIPIGYIWDGETFVMGSATTSPKVGSLSRNPRVAITIDTEDFPPNILLVRGEATLTRVEGVPDEFVEAARRFVGDAGMPEWEAGARALYKEMVLIRVAPTWAKIIDFETRLPESYEELSNAQLRHEP
ncbi:MAG: pyridoxamine 5'-phosphate oxidase family protein [Actinomycetia bacterium]|nr:pyridoxamine 5'-phosphate oxidase family protein [Actinomycetes bacterium]